MSVVETSRLILRRLTLDDLDAVHAVLGDPVALRLWPRVYTRDETADWIRRNQDRYAKEGYGLWAVVLKATGECIGDCGLVVQSVEGKAEDEIGYHLQLEHWGRGYVTEAAAACRDHAFDVLKKPRVISLIMPHNTRSRRVAERIGMRVEREIVREVGGPHLVYAMAQTDSRPVRNNSDTLL